MKNPYRGGKVHKRARFADISTKDTVKEQQTRLGRQQFARRKAEAAIAVAEIEAARYARLPWPIYVNGAVLDFVLRRACIEDPQIVEGRTSERVDVTALRHADIG